jgi:HPt (histidine-containing phosphotransfer) domain-containing protein
MNILDKETLDRFYEEICDGEIDILVDIATDCVNETQSLAKQIHSAFTAKDWELFNRSAHSMKSTTRALGGMQVSKHAEYMEHNSVGFKTPGFNPRPLTEPVSELNYHVSAFVNELRKEVAKFGGTL